MHIGFIGGAVAFFSTVFLMGIFAKYGLPFLSIPFLIGMWLMLLAFPSFNNIALNMETLYPSNMFFKLGGNTLVTVVDGLHNIFANTGFDTYFLSLHLYYVNIQCLLGAYLDGINNSLKSGNCR